MKLAEWIDREINEERAANKTAALKALEAKIKSAKGYVSFNTLAATARGQRLNLHDKALAIQTATGGEVTVTELCT